MTKTRVVVVDDHDLFRRGLVEVLADEEDVDIVGEARDGLEAAVRVEETQPDVVFMDLNMPGQGGIEATAYITQHWPTTRVLVLTVSEEPDDLIRALGVGALGYMLKTARPREILDAMRQVSQGSVIISPAMAPRFLTALAPNAKGAITAPPPHHVDQADFETPGQTQLSIREQEVLQLVAQGLSNAELADRLMVTENTIKTHMKNILSKLQLKNRSEAAAYAARLGLLR